MKRLIPASNDPDAELELELARRRALHHIQDASSILSSAMYLVPITHRQLFTAIVGDLNTLAQRLTDLEPTHDYK
jgi:hypothetical protein